MAGEPGQVIEQLAGSVYSKIVDRQELENYEAEYKVLFSTLVGGRSRLHIVSEQDPGNGFQAASASLEDVYFSILRDHKIKVAA